MEKTKSSKKYKYYAFISYNSHDTKWGERLQYKLENYSLPATLCSERGWGKYPIKPVFFAPTDIQPGGLSQELQERLKASRYLIVICSPNSAKSEWVGREIAFFHQLGRTQNIHFFIVDGVPKSGDPNTECINPIVNELGLPEILGANIHEKIYRLSWMNRERAYVQLISKLLDIEFDSLWQRHRRRLIQKVIVWTIGIIMTLSAIISAWVFNQAVNVRMEVKEVSARNENLPPLKNAIVILSLENERKTDTINTINSHCIFPNIPRKFINKSVNIKVECEDYLPVDTSLILTKDVTIMMKRDPNVYGKVKFEIWNGKGEGQGGVEVSIAGYHIVSNENGHVELFIPLEQQQKKYHITSSVKLNKDTITMPCGEDDVLILEE
jgi:hypothetical protein